MGEHPFVSPKNALKNTFKGIFCLLKVFKIPYNYFFPGQNDFFVT